MTPCWQGERTDLSITCHIPKNLLSLCLNPGDNINRVGEEAVRVRAKVWASAPTSGSLSGPTSASPLFSPRRDQPSSPGLMLYKYLTGDCSQVRVSLLSQVPRIEDGVSSSCTREGLDWILGNISSLKILSSTGTGCLGSGRVPIFGDI